MTLLLALACVGEPEPAISERQEWDISLLKGTGSGETTVHLNGQSAAYTY